MKLLDLFSGAGGSAMGYYQAGFTEITGVDTARQPRYPFNFVQFDAFVFLQEFGCEYDAVHASPPCQGYTRAKHLRGYNHPLLVEPLRELLVQSGKPYVIENVVGCPLINPVRLVGTMFDLLVLRERLFETNFPVKQPEMPIFTGKLAKMGRPPKESEYMTVVGNFSGVKYARKAMGIEWMMQRELREAIPPAYTQWLGIRLIEYMRGI